MNPQGGASNSASAYKGNTPLPSTPSRDIRPRPAAHPAHGSGVSSHQPVPSKHTYESEGRSLGRLDSLNLDMHHHLIGRTGLSDEYWLYNDYDEEDKPELRPTPRCKLRRLFFKAETRNGVHYTHRNRRLILCQELPRHEGYQEILAVFVYKEDGKYYNCYLRHDPPYRTTGSWNIDYLYNNELEWTHWKNWAKTQYFKLDQGELYTSPAAIASIENFERNGRGYRI